MGGYLRDAMWKKNLLLLVVLVAGLGAIVVLVWFVHKHGGGSCLRCFNHPVPTVPTTR